jgi:hypothetical protein
MIRISLKYKKKDEQQIPKQLNCRITYNKQEIDKNPVPLLQDYRTGWYAALF